MRIAYRSTDYYGDCRPVVARLLENGSVRLNREDEVKVTALANRLHEVFANTAERLLFIRADPDLPFQSVAKIIEIAQSEVDYLGILTPEVEKEPGVCLSVRFSGVADYHTGPAVKLADVSLWPWW